MSEVIAGPALAAAVAEKTGGEAPLPASLESGASGREVERASTFSLKALIRKRLSGYPATRRATAPSSRELHVPADRATLPPAGVVRAKAGEAVLFRKCDAPA